MDDRQPTPQEIALAVREMKEAWGVDLKRWARFGAMVQEITPDDDVADLSDPICVKLWWRSAG